MIMKTNTHYSSSTGQSTLLYNFIDTLTVYGLIFVIVVYLCFLGPHSCIPFIFQQKYDTPYKFTQQGRKSTINIFNKKKKMSVLKKQQLFFYFCDEGTLFF